MDRGDAVFRTGCQEARPNVILCMTDDQGWADVSYNELGRLTKGKFKTVELDKMAASGLRFDRFYAAAAVCSPTRGSCLTGRNPYRYGVTSPGRPLKLEEKTIAQALAAAGYRTGHFGKWHLNGKSGPGKPVAKDDPLNPGAFGFQHWFSVSNYFETNWTFSRNGEPSETEGDGSDVIVAEALRWLDERQGIIGPAILRRHLVWQSAYAAQTHRIRPGSGGRRSRTGGNRRRGSGDGHLAEGTAGTRPGPRYDALVLFGQWTARCEHPAEGRQGRNQRRRNPRARHLRMAGPCQTGADFGPCGHQRFLSDHSRGGRDFHAGRQAAAHRRHQPASLC